MGKYTDHSPQIKRLLRKNAISVKNIITPESRPLEKEERMLYYTKLKNHGEDALSGGFSLLKDPFF